MTTSVPSLGLVRGAVLAAAGLWLPGSAALGQAAEAPITIAAHPGELAVLDGGLPEFLDSPATAWEPFPGGAAGEFVSARAYPHADDRKAPHQFLPGSQEPLWGIEDERPITLGHFA